MCRCLTCLASCLTCSHLLLFILTLFYVTHYFPPLYACIVCTVCTVKKKKKKLKLDTVSPCYYCHQPPDAFSRATWNASISERCFYCILCEGELHSRAACRLSLHRQLYWNACIIWLIFPSSSHKLAIVNLHKQTVWPTLMIFTECFKVYLCAVCVLNVHCMCVCLECVLVCTCH